MHERLPGPEEEIRLRNQVLGIMAVNGWACASEGHVGSEQGRFSYIINEPAEAYELYRVFAGSLDARGLVVGQILGNWLVIDHGQPDLEVTQYQERAGLLDAYRQLETNYHHWKFVKEGYYLGGY